MPRNLLVNHPEVYGEPDHVPVSGVTPLVPKNPYEASKHATEAYCQIWEKVSEVDCLILRFANVYGPGDRDRVIPRWLRRAREGQELELYVGQQVLDFLGVSYAVAALLPATSCKNEGPINVGSGRGSALKNWLDASWL